MPDSAEWIAYRNSRPAKRMGSGALLRDLLGRVLVVEPTYKSTWDVPGGCVEADESPRDACQRELAEELGFEVQIGRMLVMEWQGPEPERTESLMFIYDGGICAPEDISLAADELASYAFVEPENLGQYLVPRLARRMRAALVAADEDRFVEMERGLIVHSAGTTSTVP
jgi:8-oxo-dGTP diphosphatase